MMRSAEDSALRAELSEARFAIQRQLELLRYPSSAGSFGRRTCDNREIVAMLQQQLKDIEDALANLEG